MSGSFWSLIVGRNNLFFSFSKLSFKSDYTNDMKHVHEALEALIQSNQTFV